MNVLITSAGRRGYLVEYFQRALDGAGTVIAGDIRADAPALAQADVAVVLPPFDSQHYLDAVLGVVQDHAIGLLLTVNDYDARTLAPHRTTLRRAGCLPLLPDEQTVDLVTDKLQLAAWCRAQGIGSPATFAAGGATSLGELGLRAPAVVKPRFGSASLSTFVVQDDGEFTAARILTERASVDVYGRHQPGATDLVLAQEFVDGDEYGMDVVNDHRGHHMAVLLRRKLAMRSGETDRAVTVRDPVLEAFGRRVGEALGHVGCLDCDVVVRDHQPHLLDANPRLGGGYPFVHLAGADLPRAFLSWAANRPAPPECFAYAAGVVAVKTTQLVASEQPTTIRA